MTNTKKTLLSMQGIDKSFPGVKALSQAGLSVYAGQVMALIGENGAGKSTLMKVLTGIYRADAGKIKFKGNSVAFSGPRESQNAGISIIHQELNLIAELSVGENIFLGREPRTSFGRIDWHKLYTDTETLLSRLNVSFSGKEKVANLSIGQKQMVEIAKALSFESQVIIMDEPTDALTDRETSTLFTIIEELRAEGRGIVYISHRLHEIFSICDDVTVLRDGSFVWEKSVAEIDEAQLIQAMVGRELNEQYPYMPNNFITKHGPILTVKNLSGYGVKNVSFSLERGEILGIFGLMGAGRTELVKMIYGALSAKSGEIILADKTIRCRSSGDGLSHGIAYVSEDRKKDGLILGMSIRENISLSSLKQFTKMTYINRGNEKQTAKRFQEKMSIRTPSIEQPVGLLSGGNQQKVAIAKGLLSHPNVLIVDEPTRGVDVGAKKEIYQLLNELKVTGIGIIMVSSDMPEILGMSDRILTLQNGCLTGEFDHNKANQENLLEASIMA